MNQHNMFDELNNRFRESSNVKCFLKNIAFGESYIEAYLEPKRISTMERFGNVLNGLLFSQ